MDHIPTTRTTDSLSERAGNLALTPTLINGITYIPAAFGLGVIVDGVTIRRTHIKVSARTGEGLLADASVIKDELVYLINATLGHYAWDAVQILGADGGLVKTVDNPQKLPSDCRHPPLNRRHLVYLDPAP